MNLAQVLGQCVVSWLLARFFPMPFQAGIIAFVFAYVFSACHGRRVQISSTQMQSTSSQQECSYPAFSSNQFPGNCRCPTGFACSQDGENVGCPILVGGIEYTEDAMFHSTCDWCQCYRLLESPEVSQCPDPTSESIVYPGNCECPRGYACSEDGHTIGCPILLRGQQYTEDAMFHSTCDWCQCYEVRQEPSIFEASSWR
mmetsp:Transcript_22053/g.42341  ORF Transcript_22053/g.42341 Transcript_22053/m.42341 type:complete len:200 (-) Transcript_22053:87-686(-)